MAHGNPEFISQFIDNQFPEYFQENQQGLVQFVLAYYEWLEEQGNTTQALRALRENRDIDETVDSFIVHFKNMFLQGTPLQTEVDDRFLLKHISDLYQSKGSIRSIELLIKILFGQEANVFLPSSRILIPSESKWFKPVYLELGDSPRTKDFVGRQVTGSATGAKGFIESVITKLIANKRVTLAYLSGVQGNFQTGEVVTDDGVIENAPIIIGSLNSITVTNGGRGFSIGDIFDVVSSDGRGARARVSSVLDATGRVDFDLLDGGYGYTTNAAGPVDPYTRTLVSNATLIVENITNANTDIEDFFLFETVEQPLQTVTYDFTISDHSDFLDEVVANVVVGANSTVTNVASGTLVSTSTSGNDITISIVPEFGSFDDTDYIHTGNTDQNVQFSTSANTWTTGEYIGTRLLDDNISTTIGVISNTGPFFETGVVRGLDSNTYANVANVGTGSGADWAVGLLGEQESLTLFTDIIGDYNQATPNVQYINILTSGANSGIGFADTIKIDESVTIDTLSNTTYYFVNDGGFDADQEVFAANVYVDYIFVREGGSGYSNADTVVFTGGAPGTSAAASLTTWANGTINFLSFSNNGIDYEGQPAITITTSTGTGANLVAVMGAERKDTANGYVKTANATHLVLYNVVGTFNSGDVIANFGANAFANCTGSSPLSGTGWLTGETIEFSGGGGSGAQGIVTANAANGGSIDSIAVTPGLGYDSVPTLTGNTTSGTGESYTLNMDWGYGFPKDNSADLTTILYDALTFANFTIGEIASLNYINPGTGYNLEPVVIAHNPYIAGFNRRDLICIVNNVTGTFNIGEKIEQTVTFDGYLINHNGNITPDPITSASIIIGEGVLQNTTGATGIIESSNSTHIKVSDTIGTFTDAYDIVTLSSNNTITPQPAGVVFEESTDIASGRVKSVVADTANPGVFNIFIKRLSFGVTFTSGLTLTGLASGATATVTYAYQDENTLPIGLNAVIDADVISASGVVSELEVFDSGYGYSQNSAVSLINEESPFIVSGLSVLERQGEGAGFWRTRASFPSDTPRIHDNDYYQEYSYVVQTGLALAKYEDILKEILHVAGLKLFGEVTRVDSTDALTLEVADSSLTAANTYEAWMN